MSTKLQLARTLYGNKFHTMGETLKQQSNLIMNDTWWNDIQAKKCYIYDYYHDSQPNLCKNLSPEKDPLKTPIDAKYIVAQYGTVSKDQVEYHLQFRPNSRIPIDYYSYYEDKYKAEYPIGLYIDIPDNTGIYRRWIIVSSSQELSFIKYSILPCNYQFVWCKDHQIHKMWGVARLRNSYNSGLWTDYITTSIENQDQMWLPMNDISADLYYDDRLIISADIPKPITWNVSKVENLHPFGINKLTLVQTKFDPNIDAKIDGFWIAGYNKSNIIPEEITNTMPLSQDKYVIEYTGKQQSFKIGGGYKTIIINKISETSSKEPTTVDSFSFVCNDQDISNLFDVLPKDNAAYKIKFLGSDDYLDQKITIGAILNTEEIASLDFDIVGL